MNATITPAPPTSPSDIDVSSIRLNGTYPIVPGSDDVQGGSLRVKFQRSDVVSAIGSGNTATLTVTGQVGKGCFSASDQIKVKQSTMSQPLAGSLFAFGQEIDLAWTADPEVDNVSVITSYDNGATWSIAADGVDNTGTYRWTVPAIASDQARVGVIQIYETNGGEWITNAEVSESGAFTIASAAGVGGSNLSFALRGIAPNPSSGQFRVNFSLPGASPATLRVFDVTGRQMAERQVGGLGAGLHTVVLGDRESLSPGLYLVRLTQGMRKITSRVLVVP